MVSGLVCSTPPGSSGPGSRPGWGHCVVFLDKTLKSQVPLSTRVYKWVSAILMLRVNPALD